MGNRSLPASVLKKLNRRLKNHEGYRLRGRHAIEVRFSSHGQRLSKTFSASADVFKNLEAAIQWQCDKKASLRLIPSPEPRAPYLFKDWSVANLLEMFQEHHRKTGKTSYNSHTCTLLNQVGNSHSSPAF